MSSAGTAKVLEKLHAAIASGDFYEAHQMYRTVLTRYMKQRKYDEAATLAHAGAMALLRAQQAGSGGDVALQFVEALSSGGMAVTLEQGARILELFRLFPSDGHTQRNAFMKAAIQWTSKFGVSAGGDPALHHVLGEALAADGAFAQAEKHLLAGTKQSAVVLAQMIPAWAQSMVEKKRVENATMEESETDVEQALLLQSVLKYLCQKNIRDASTFLAAAIPALTYRSNTDTVTVDQTSLTIYRAQPLVNCAQLLVLLVQRSNGADAFRELRQRYGMVIQQHLPDGVKLFAQLGADYFGIVEPKQLNIGDLLGAFLGGPQAAAR